MKNFFLTLLHRNKNWLIGMVFPLSLVIVYAIFHSLYFKVSDETLKTIYHDYLITISVDIINFLQPVEQVFARNNSLLSSKANLEIVRGCDGAGVMFLIVAAILVFSASVRDKLFGLILGLGLVYLLNQIRIVGLYFIVAYHPDWFLPIHAYFAPTLIVILCCLYFAWWAFWTAGSNCD